MQPRITNGQQGAYAVTKYLYALRPAKRVGESNEAIHRHLLGSGSTHELRLLSS